MTRNIREGFTWDLLTILPGDGKAGKITVYYDELAHLYQIKQNGYDSEGIIMSEKQFKELENSIFVFKPGEEGDIDLDQFGEGRNSTITQEAALAEGKKPKKAKKPVELIRKPTAPPTIKHKDKAEKSRSKVKQDLKKGNYKDEGCSSMKKGKKKVNESVDKMSFKDLVKLVIESGGQQKINPVDDALWDWAERVAATKVESKKQEMYTGLLYERYGGKFRLQDVLSEADTKDKKEYDKDDYDENGILKPQSARKDGKGPRKVYMQTRAQRMER